jgi:hypothetical protein
MPLKDSLHDLAFAVGQLRGPAADVLFLDVMSGRISFESNQVSPRSMARIASSISADGFRLYAPAPRHSAE